MMNFVNIDRSNFPIVTFKISPFEPSLEIYKNYLNDVTEILNRHENMVFIFDLSVGKPLSSEIRILQGEWIKNKEELIKNKLKGMVFVHNSIIMNLMMKGIFLIKKPPVPYVVTKNIEEALNCANEQYHVRKTG